MKEMLTRAIALGRQGALSRPVFGKPRGTRTQAATRREPVPGHYYPGTPAWFIVLDEPLDLEAYVGAMQTSTDEEMRVASASVVGEVGDASCIAALGGVLLADGDTATRRSAAHALASIGGPEAEELLWRALENRACLTSVRERALQSLLDLLTPDGWENYTFMNSDRVALPADARARLLRVTGLSYNVAHVVELFDAEAP